jgi:hypothetical protein
LASTPDLAGWIEPLSGRVDFLNRQIHIALTRLRDDSMPEALLHHMAHASTMTLDDTDEAWITEMRRLRELADGLGAFETYSHDYDFSPVQIGAIGV